MQIRLATTQDADALSELAATTFRETFTHYEPTELDAFLATYYTPADFLGYLSNPRERIWLAVSNSGALTGYAKYRPYTLPVASPHTPTGELHRLYVRHEHKGHGIGNRLMKEVLFYAAEQNDAAVCLSVWEGNESAKAFYQRQGFEKIGTYIYDPPVGAVIDTEWVMMKHLKAAPIAA